MTSPTSASRTDVDTAAVLDPSTERLLPGEKPHEAFERVVLEAPLPDLGRRRPEPDGLLASLLPRQEHVVPMLVVVLSLAYTSVIHELLLRSGIPACFWLGAGLLVVYNLLALLALASFYQCAATDAGSVPPLWAFRAGEDSKRRRYCRECRIWKPARCHHCSLCNRCTLCMHHHTRWLDNCIGFYNRKFFLQLLAFLACLLVLFPLTAIPACAAELRAPSLWAAGVIAVAFSVSMLSSVLASVLVPFLVLEVRLLCDNSTTVENLESEPGAPSRFDLGVQGNVAQVFGARKSLWWFPAHTSLSRPVGDGLAWPLSDGTVLDFDREEFSRPAGACKLVLLGAAATGKSYLASRFLAGTLPRTSTATVGAEFRCREVDGGPVELWECGGQERYKPLECSEMWRAAAGVAIIYDVTRRDTFDATTGWLQLARERAPGAAVVLVGNKIDRLVKQPSLRQVQRDEGEEAAGREGLLFEESSAVTGHSKELHRLLEEARNRQEAHKDGRGGRATCPTCGCGELLLAILLLAQLVLLVRIISPGGCEPLEEGTPLTTADTKELAGADVFAEVLRPASLQPFYLLPLTNGAKFTVTFVLFGFDLRFTPPSSAAETGSTGALVKQAAGCGLILLSLNGYYQDLRQLFQPSVGVATRLLLLSAVMVTSPNYITAMTLWGSLAIQSPTALLGLRPKYLALCRFAFPIVPGGVEWLPLLKHLFALLLLPYAALRLCLQGSICFCCLAIACAKGVCWTYCFALLVMLSAGVLLLFSPSWAEEQMEWAMPLLSPLLYVGAIGFWGAWSPHVFSCVYGLARRVPIATVADVLSRAGPGVWRSLWPSVPRLQGSERERLLEYNRHALAADFELDSEDTEAASEGSDDLDAVRVAIVFSTLTFLMPVLLEQLLTLQVARCVHLEGWHNATVRTISERSATSYARTLKGLAFNGWENASRTVDVLWNLL